MRFATCTPVNFSGEARFFTRDTGLLCRGFQAAGFECFVVMPGPEDVNEPSDLIRCREEDLISSVWWKNTGINVVILYAWGDPRYLPVAKAIRSADIRLIQSLDTSGFSSPFANFMTWLESTLAELKFPQTSLSRLRRSVRIARDLIPAIYEHKRLQMLNECDHLAAVSPPACDSMTSYLQGLGRPDIAKKLIVIPHPVSSVMNYRGEEKAKRVLVVGRWGTADAAQKDPNLTLRVLAHFLLSHPDWDAEIIGPEAIGLDDNAARILKTAKSRLTLKNFVKHDELRELYATSRILLCASRFESFHIASAEAVCCGCSVVVAAHPLLASTSWFTSMTSGTIATQRSVESLAKALNDEVDAINDMLRDPIKISETWTPNLHAQSIALNIIGLIDSL